MRHYQLRRRNWGAKDTVLAVLFGRVNAEHVMKMTFRAGDLDVYLARVYPKRRTG